MLSLDNCPLKSATKALVSRIISTHYGKKKSPLNRLQNFWLYHTGPQIFWNRNHNKFIDKESVQHVTVSLYNDGLLPFLSNKLWWKVILKEKYNIQVISPV